jgi:plasmid stabilization system protein ParE
MTEVVLLQSAQSDWFSIYRRRDDSFERPFVRAMALLEINPEIGTKVHVSPYRRLLIANTTFGIFYSVSGNRVYVAAILDLRQDPERIDQRLLDLLP